MSQKQRKQKRYKKAVTNAYNLLVSLRKQLEEHNNHDYANEVEEACKDLWLECMNETAPWM